MDNFDASSDITDALYSFMNLGYFTICSGNSSCKSLVVFFFTASMTACKSVLERTNKYNDGRSLVSAQSLHYITGTNKYNDGRRLVSAQSLPLQMEPRSVVIPAPTTDKPGKFAGAAMENPSVKVAVADKEAKEIVRNMMVDMPCVTTKGEGPNGRKIEGFLYRYKKGEEVRIVCVCHGSFLTPAEFVKHAGGGDVPNPLKHIVVNPSRFL